MKREDFEIGTVAIIDAPANVTLLSENSGEHIIKKPHEPIEFDPRFWCVIRRLNQETGPDVVVPNAIRVHLLKRM